MQRRDNRLDVSLHRRTSNGGLQCERVLLQQVNARKERVDATHPERVIERGSHHTHEKQTRCQPEIGAQPDCAKRR